jgi:hypothetical protein
VILTWPVFICVTLTLSFIAPIASAKLFKNTYVQFELPENWNCSVEGTEWVCASKDKNDSKESTIILTAKDAGPQDSFAAYETHLRTPRRVHLDNGKTLNSEIRHVRQRKINDHPWIDSLHLGSEIPGYYTRYLATIKGRLAILVTLSAHQKFFTKYSNDYFKAIESLRVTATSFSANTLAPVRSAHESYGGGLQNSLPPLADYDVPSATDTGGALETTGSTIALSLGLFFFFGALIYFFFPSKKKRRRR